MSTVESNGELAAGFIFFFFNDTATTEIYTLSLHDALPISVAPLDPLLSDEGWAYASLPPQEPGDPGRFHALFGRDSLITALQVLPVAPEVARATLRALASRQGRVEDPETDEEPGKIPHEYRPVAGPWFAENRW